MKLWIWTFIDVQITSLDEVLNVLEKMGIAQIAAPSFICRQFWQSKPDTGLNWLFFLQQSDWQEGLKVATNVT
jgi:hypothetical protein